MAFTGNEGDTITLTEGKDWTANYRTAAGSGCVKGHAFGVNKLNLILSQTGCLGIRAYYAIDASGTKQLVLVGVDSNGCDMYNGVLLDKSVMCPPYCDTASPLQK